MEPFEIAVEGRIFNITPANHQGKMKYTVLVDGHEVIFVGNPNIGGALLIPENTPDEIPLSLLEDIADRIESYLL